MREITVNASLEEIRRITGHVNALLKELACPERIRIQIDVAIDEVFSNISRYAYYPETGQATVRLEVERDPLCVVITFIDRGAPYNPLTAKEPDLSLPARKRPVGGLGLFMVRRIMDGVTYGYRDGQNILTIRKRI